MNQQQITPVTFTSPVTADGLRAALDEHGLIEQRVLVRFYGAANCIVNKHQRKLLHQTTGRFFVGTNGFLCFQPPAFRRSGYRVGNALEIDQLASIEPITKVQLSDEQKRAKDVARFKSLLRRAHPNFDAEWLRSVSDGKCTKWQARVIRPSKYFSSWVIENMQKAFDDCTEYSHGRSARSHSGRDMRFEIKPSEDGKKVKAWFNSYLPGTGNGTSYVLFSPDFASLAEDD